MTRQGKDKEAHDSMLKIRADDFNSKGYSVKADHIEGYEQPDKINGHIPDIIAKGNEEIIVEVETKESYDKEHTKEQFKAFSDPIQGKFHVVVPESCLREAQQQTKEWGIKVDQWWSNPNY